MKTLFSTLLLSFAVLMVSCGGNKANKPVENVEETTLEVVEVNPVVDTVFVEDASGAPVVVETEQVVVAE